MIRSNFGLSSEVLGSLIAVFSKNTKIKKVLVYGSRAKGNFRAGSDIDLTLVGDQLNTTDLFKVENEIEDLLLPYKVDLSLFHQIENPSLVDHINRVGVALYTAD